MSDYLNWFLDQTEGRINAIAAGRMFPEEFHHVAIVENELRHATECNARRPFPGVSARLEELQDKTKTLPQEIEQSRSELTKRIWGGPEQWL